MKLAMTSPAHSPQSNYLEDESFFGLNEMEECSGTDFGEEEDAVGS